MGRLLKETPFSEILATLEVFDSWNVGPEAFARIRRNHDTFGREVSAFMNYGHEMRNRYFLLADTVLGNDVIFPEEITVARGLSYAKDQIRHLIDTLPSYDVLVWLKMNNFCLMPGPPTPMSLLDVRFLEPKLFFSESDGWYADPRQDFARYDKAICEWLAIRKDPVPDSTRKNCNEQLMLLSEHEEVPNAGEMSWFITTFYKVRGVRLFEAIYIRTSSMDSGDAYVTFGSFDEVGLGVNHWRGHSGQGDLGLAPARRLVNS